MNQKDFFDHLFNKTGTIATIVNSSDTFQAKRLPYTEYDFKKPTIGRYVFENELAAELDLHNSVSLTQDWKIINKTAVDFVNYKNHTLGRFTGTIPFGIFDSGRGIHLSMFTKNLVDFSEKNGIKPRLLAKEVWKLLGFKSKYVDNCLLNRRTNSVIRAEGGLNPKSGSYKSLIPNTYRPKKFYREKEVIYPEIKLWKVPKGILNNSLKIIRRRELLKKLTKEEPKTGLMYLYCFKKLISTSIPPTGKTVRNKLSSVIAYCCLAETGNEELAKKYLTIYEDLCIEKDTSFPRGSQLNWCSTILRDGINNWNLNCGMIKYYENLLNRQGFNCTLCDKKCKYYR